LSKRLDNKVQIENAQVAQEINKVY